MKTKFDTLKLRFKSGIKNEKEMIQSLSNININMTDFMVEKREEAMDLIMDLLNKALYHR